MYDFGARVRELRIEMNWTQAQLARKCEVSKNTISGIENNVRQPSIVVLGSLADALNTTTDYLLGREKKRTVFVDGLNDRQVALINGMIEECKRK